MNPMLQCFGHLIHTANSLEKTPMLGNSEGRRKKGWQKMRWLEGKSSQRINGITDLVDMNLCKLQEIVTEREAWHAAVLGVPESWTWLGDWTTAIVVFAFLFAYMLIWNNELYKSGFELSSCIFGFVNQEPLSLYFWVSYSSYLWRNNFATYKSLGGHNYLQDFKYIFPLIFGLYSFCGKNEMLSYGWVFVYDKLLFSGWFEHSLLCFDFWQFY